MSTINPADHLRLVGGMMKRYASYQTDALLALGVEREDIEAELYLALVVAARGYDPTTGYTFGTYFMTVGRNHLNGLLEYHNAEKRRPLGRVVPLGLLGPDHESRYLTAKEPDGPSDPFGDVERLRGIVGEMPPRLRKIIGLRYWVGLTQSETARRMFCSANWVRQLEQRALSLIEHKLRQRRQPAVAAG